MSERREPEAVVYPGAPLRAVAIEVSFPRQLDALSKFGEFQRRHRADYDPNLIDTPAPDDANSKEERVSRPPRITLMSRSRQRAVSVSQDQLAVVTYDYSQGSAGFVPWGLALVREGLLDLGVDEIRAVHYKYENRIKTDTRSVELGRFFKLSLAAPHDAGSVTQHTHLYWHQKWPDGVVRVELDACPYFSKTEIHLNFTARIGLPAGTIADLESSVAATRRMARLTFEDLITDSFRERVLEKGGGGKDAGPDRPS